MKEQKIIRFDTHDIENIIKLVCKKKFGELTIADINAEANGDFTVIFEEVDLEKKETVDEN